MAEHRILTVEDETAFQEEIEESKKSPNLDIISLKNSETTIKTAIVAGSKVIFHHPETDTLTNESGIMI